MTRRHRVLAALGAAVIAAAGLLAVGARSQAFVRSLASDKAPLFQPGSCAWIAPESGGSNDLSLDVVSATLGRAIANWQSATLDTKCSYLKINQDPPSAGEAVVDYRNLVKFRSDKWCRPAEPSTMSAEFCFPKAATAITTVFYVMQPDGQIIDADIEMNQIDFTFVVEPTTKGPRPGTQIADLENTLTHELGHFQGLDHTCWDHTKPYETVAPIDNNGASVPDCNLLDGLPLAQSVKIKNATMYNFASPGEITKREPKPDDINGICTVYAASADPGTCSRLSAAPKTGCSVGRGTPPAAAALLLLPLLGLVLRHRRARSQASS